MFANRKISFLAIAAFLSACSDYAGKIEDDYKDQFGDKEKFLEKMNTYDGSWAEVCASDEWVWCAATSEGKIMGKANNGESWTQFTDGSAKLNFTGKDENAYHFTTNLLPSDVSSIVRENGGIKIELVDGEGSEAGIQLQVGHLGSYSEISVLTVKTGGTKPFISLRNVNANGDVVSEWRFYLYTTEGESVQTATFTEFKHVSGNSDLADFIKNEVNTVAIGNSTVNNSLRIVALKFGGVPFGTETSSSSGNGDTVVSSSSNKGGTTTSGSSTEKKQLTGTQLVCGPVTKRIKVGESVQWQYVLDATINLDTPQAEWTLEGGDPRTVVKNSRSTTTYDITYSTSGTKSAKLNLSSNNYYGSVTCSTLEVVENETASSSSTAKSSSSSAKSSSSATPDPVTGFLWDGSKKSDFVKTDFGSGNKWYIFTDADTDSGSTYVSVPEINPYDVCLGKCIGVKFGEPVGNNERQPYAGVGFDLGESGAIYDVSGWQGICIAYQSIITSHSSAELRVDLRPYDPDYYGYNIPAHTLPVNVTGLGADYHIENILWSEFAQRWNDTDELSGTDVAAMLRGISITLESDPNTVAYLNIYQIGSYGRCSNVQATSVDMSLFPFPESSSSAAQSSSSVENPQVTCANDDLWCGPQGIYKVLTGLDAGDETSGYWFSYADDANGGNSRIDWPVGRGNEYSPDAFDPVVDYCGGICGTYTLDKGTLDYDPDVGVGFSIAGTKDGSPKPVAADASGWGGVCITYTADNAAKLILDLGDAKNAQLASDKPFVDLGKKTEPQEKCFAWSDFEQAGWGVSSGGTTISGYEASKILVYLNFEIQAKTGTTGGFNVIRIRKYPEGLASSSSTSNPAWEYLNPAIEYGEFTDERDGQVYKTIEIGDQIWMAQNLNYAYSAGTGSLDSSSFCYDNDPVNCLTNGRLYMWSAAMDSAGVVGENSANGCGSGVNCSVSGTLRGVCPSGWHLPSNTEFEALYTTVGGRDVAGDVLKTTTGWSFNGYAINGSNTSGFAALPAGFRDEGEFAFLHAYAYFWTTNQISGHDNDNRAECFDMNNAGNDADSHLCLKESALSVRCIKNSLQSVYDPNGNTLTDLRDGNV